MPDTKTADTKPFTCKSARRHMQPHVFITYDAMCACVDDKQIFYGSTGTLANLNNRSPEQERQALAALLELGWIEDLHPEQDRRRFKGRLSTNEYRVLTHPQYVAKHGDCPPARYDEKTNRPITPGALAPGLRRANVRKLIGAVLPDQWLDAIADAIDTKKATNTGGPVQVPTNTGIPVQAESTSTGSPVQANTGAPVQANTGAPVQTYTGAPVESLTPSITSSKTTSPTISANAATNTGTPVTSNTENGGGRAEALHPDSKPAAMDANGDMSDEEYARATRSYDEFLWQEFFKQIPEELHGAVPKAEQKAAIIKQLNTHGRYVLPAVRAWVDNREMPIEERKYNKWGAWLDECGPFLEEQRKQKALDKKLKERGLSTEKVNPAEAEIQRLIDEEQAARAARCAKFAKRDTTPVSEAPPEDYL